MAIELSARAEILSKKIKVQQQIILDIPAFPNIIFGAFEVTKVVRIGEDDLTIGEFIIGGVTTDERSKAYISLNKSTDTYTQQLLVDRGGTGSVSKLKIRLIDKNDEMTALFQPGSVIDDLLGERAVAYLNMVGGAHPEDSVELLDGVIDDYKFGSGYCDLMISSAEQKKRIKILPDVNTILNGAIDDTTTTVILTDNAEDLAEAKDIFTTYVIIDDEIIEYTGISSQTLTGVTRGARGTIAAAHDDEASINNLYYYNEDAIPLALKVMLSDGGDSFAEDVAIDSFNQVEASVNIQNAIKFNIEDVQKFYGLTVGDFVDSSGAAEGANNFIGREIASFGKNSTGSYVVVNGANLVTETASSALIEFTSKYNTLSEEAGLGMSPQQVDVDRHEEINDAFSASLPTLDVPIYQEQDGQQLINEKIYFPSGLYQVPRARASVNYTAPPLALGTTQKLTLENVHNISKLRIDRSTTENFYNRVLYTFGYDPISQKNKSSTLKTSTPSLKRVKVGLKTLRITAEGLPASEKNFTINQANRFLNRYRYGAESLKAVEISYNEGLKIEIGDVAIFGEPDMKLSDSTNGTRNFNPRLFEVINKDMSLKNGDFKLTILDTGYDLNTRVGTIAPTSKIGSGATTSNIPTEYIWGGTSLKTEAEKWANYIGLSVLIRNDDYSVQEVVTLKGFSATIQDLALLDPPLSFVPTSDYYMDTPNYEDAESLYKSLHTFLNPAVNVVSGSSQTEFTVSVGDIGKFIVGKLVELHNESYSEISNEVEVESIDIGTNTITVDSDLGFTPNNTHIVELIGFVSDNGDPYRIL